MSQTVKTIKMLEIGLRFVEDCAKGKGLSDETQERGSKARKWNWV